MEGIHLISFHSCITFTRSAALSYEIHLWTSKTNHWLPSEHENAHRVRQLWPYKFVLMWPPSHPHNKVGILRTFNHGRSVNSFVVFHEYKNSGGKQNKRASCAFFSSPQCLMHFQLTNVTNVYFLFYSMLFWSVLFYFIHILYIWFDFTSYMFGDSDWMLGI